MSNKEGKQKEVKAKGTKVMDYGPKLDIEKTSVEYVPPLDKFTVKFLQSVINKFGSPSALDKIAEAAPPLQPDPHYMEYLYLRGYLDLDLNDPDLAPLFQKKP